MIEALIQAEELVKTFGKVTAVNHVSLQVRAGEIYGLVGPDGAGKTTTIRLLCGAMQPDDGEVIIGGFNLAKHVDQAREQIGYLSQRFSLYEDLTVQENLHFFAEVRNLRSTEWTRRSQEILKFVGLTDFVDRRAGQLSGGMKQKLGLATALVHRPRVLLLDEPTGGVDPVTRQDFWQLIIHLVTEEGISVLVSTPYMDEAVRCTYVGFMMNGRQVIENKPKDLCDRLIDRMLELRGYPIPKMRKMINSIDGIEDVQAFGDRLHIRVKQGEIKPVIQRIQSVLSESDIHIEGILPVPASLEDVFIQILQQYQSG